jgi:Zn-finger nucleic acid-binding protein
MPEINHQGINFNICSPGCKGIWCHQGELAYYLETKKDTKWEVELDTSGSSTNFNCPVCADTKLKEYPYIKGNDLLLDICPKCRGIFLDFKELSVVGKLSINIDSDGKLQRSLNNLIELATKDMP